MIDPDGIILNHNNENTTINFGNVPEYDFITWDLSDDKELKKFISSIEREVRGSFEYKQMINYLKKYMGMDQCSFIKVSSRDNYNIKIEIHHYPFTLYDITEIVYKKRCAMGESLELQMIAKEIMSLHYKLLVGLIPLSITAHQLVHDSKLFIPVNNVLGNYNLFVESYGQFATPEQLETLHRIELYSQENQSKLYNTISILDQKNINISYTDTRYQLPDLNNISNSMTSRIEDIKINNYKLPTIDDITSGDLYKKDDISVRSVESPIFQSRKE
jgi:hypothetical protein